MANGHLPIHFTKFAGEPFLLAAGEGEKIQEELAFTLLATDFLSYGVAEGFVAGRTRLVTVADKKGLPPALRKRLKLLCKKVNSEGPGAQIALAMGNLLRSGNGDKQGSRSTVPGLIERLRAVRTAVEDDLAAVQGAIVGLELANCKSRTGKRAGRKVGLALAR